ncbi:hypothetical protein ACFL5O_06170 [Myxococcota bacterium]
MLKRDDIEKAVDLQRRGYRLLKWLEEAFKKGFIAPHSVHGYATLAESAHAWMSTHYMNLPDEARPERQDLEPFSQLLASYLESTFDLEMNPGEHLYSPDAHCFCPMCSWMVRAPHLKAKKLTRADKARADNLKRGFIRALAAKQGVSMPDERVEEIMQDRELREAASLCAYAKNLLERLEGIIEGPATLALWRGFAWTPEGSPKKGFLLTADAIMKAEARLMEQLNQPGAAEAHGDES